MNYSGSAKEGAESVQNLKKSPYVLMSVHPGVFEGTERQWIIHLLELAYASCWSMQGIDSIITIKYSRLFSGLRSYTKPCFAVEYNSKNPRRISRGQTTLHLELFQLSGWSLGAMRWQGKRIVSKTKPGYHLMTMQGGGATVWYNRTLQIPMVDRACN